MADDGRGIGAEEEFQSLKGVEGGLSYDQRDARVRESFDDFVGGGHVRRRGKWRRCPASLFRK